LSCCKGGFYAGSERREREGKREEINCRSVVDICKECEVTEYVCQYNIIIMVEWREEEKEREKEPPFENEGCCRMGRVAEA